MLTVCSSFALGQAIPGAVRTLDVQAGATFTLATPDYTPEKALGYGIFGDVDFTPHWGAELEFHSVGIRKHSPAKERTFEYGVRYHRTYGRFNPYIKGLAGRGTFDFAPDFQQLGASAGYNLLAGGGGLDASITTRFTFRVGMEYQHWFTGGVSGPELINYLPVTGVYLPHGLTPVLYEVGIAYHFTGGTNIQ